MPVTATIGAEVRGLDLRDLDDDRFAVLLDAIHEHGVAFIRGADLSEDEHLALGRRFGELRTFELLGVMGQTGPTLTTIADGPDSPPTADSWHTDVTWVAEPPAYALLQGLQMPERGGDTMWASTAAVHDALSPAVQEFVCGLEVVHDNTVFIEKVAEKAPGDSMDETLERLRELYPPVTHPLVRTHPATGRRSVFLGGYFMRHVVGLRPAESDAVLGMLSSMLDEPRFQVRWKWTPGDLAIWDERTTNHRAVADHFPQVRAVRRCEVAGERPVFTPV